MFGTLILTDQNAEFKDFKRLNKPAHKKFTGIQKNTVTKSISNKTKFVNMFFFSDGSVELKEINTIYCLEHILDSRDVLLPKNPKFLDWVLLYYEQTTVVFDVTQEHVSKMKILGNGNRIMGFDEPMLCDMEFMSLRFVYAGPIEGWILC